MDLRQLLTPARVIAALRVEDKAQLLAELSRRAANATGLPQGVIQERILAREGLGSSGIGGGVAIPHARLEELDHFLGFFARLDHALNFDAIDDKPVDLVFLLLVPLKATHEHLQALACVSRSLRDPTLLAELRRAEDTSAIHAALMRRSGAGIGTDISLQEPQS